MERGEARFSDLLIIIDIDSYTPLRTYVVQEQTELNTYRIQTHAGKNVREERTPYKIIYRRVPIVCRGGLRHGKHGGSRKLAYTYVYIWGPRYEGPLSTDCPFSFDRRTNKTQQKGALCFTAYLINGDRHGGRPCGRQFPNIYFFLSRGGFMEMQ